VIAAILFRLFSALAAYAAFSTLRLEQEAKAEQRFERRLEVCLAAKDRAGAAARWLRTENSQRPIFDRLGLDAVANELVEMFRDVPLNRYATLGGGVRFHENWGGNNFMAMETLISGLGAYNRAIWETLKCIRDSPESISGLACLTTASRLSDSDMTVLFYGSCTLPGSWEVVKELIEETHLFSYHPKGWEFYWRNVYFEEGSPRATSIFDESAFLSFVQR